MVGWAGFGHSSGGASILIDTVDKLLPYGRQAIDESDIAAVTAVLRGDFLTTGPVVESFENALALRVQARYAVACSSGTAALHLAALALGLGEKSTVIVPTLTFLATANAVRYVGAEVEFADVDPRTGLMTAETFEAAKGRVTAAGRSVDAVFPVHLNGQCVDLEKIREIAADLRIVEDACHVLGGTYGNRPVGHCQFSDMAVFSFHPVKAIAMGEGGVVTTNDAALQEKLLRFRNHGMVRDRNSFEVPEEALDAEGNANAWYYEMPEPGFNYRASDIHCALGLSQLTKLDTFLSARNARVARYDTLLSELSPIVRPIDRVPGGQPAWHLYAVQIDFSAAGVTRNVLMKRLRDRGIGSQVHYLPVHLQPYYKRRYGELSLPGATAYYNSALSLPLFATMTDADVDRVVSSLKEVLKS